MEENWKPIVGYDSLYMVSSLGRVLSLEKRVFCINKNGRKSYFKVLPSFFKNKL
jgi:hypothetical protein